MFTSIDEVYLLTVLYPIKNKFSHVIFLLSEQKLITKIIRMSSEEGLVIVAAADAVSKSLDEENSPYTELLDQKISAVKGAIEKNSHEKEAIEEEVRALKRSLEPLFGAAFMRR